MSVDHGKTIILSEILFYNNRDVLIVFAFFDLVENSIIAENIICDTSVHNFCPKNILKLKIYFQFHGGN